jgi:hypothetical protein
MDQYGVEQQLLMQDKAQLEDVCVMWHNKRRQVAQADRSRL